MTRVTPPHFSHGGPAINFGCCVLTFSMPRIMHIPAE
jgi:hypothetical protein